MSLWILKQLHPRRSAASHTQKKSKRQIYNNHFFKQKKLPKPILILSGILSCLNKFFD